MNEVPMYYLSLGQADQALLWVMNNYLPYGIFWLFIGLAILGVTHGKSKSAGISGFVFAMFISIVNAALPVEVQAYFSVVVAVLLFMVVYRVVR